MRRIVFTVVIIAVMSLNSFVFASVSGQGYGDEALCTYTITTQDGMIRERGFINLDPKARLQKKDIVIKAYERLDISGDSTTDFTKGQNGVLEYELEQASRLDINLGPNFVGIFYKCTDAYQYLPFSAATPGRYSVSFYNQSNKTVNMKYVYLYVSK